MPFFTSFARPPHAAWLLAGLVATGCMQAPQAALSHPPRPEAAWSEASGAACTREASAAAALAELRKDLRADGLDVRAHCTPGAADWQMELVVRNAHRAARVLRGPLAEGEAVDMGTPAGVREPRGSAQEQLSPDVQFNREWLRTALQHHRFEHAEAGWWHYARRSANGLELAVR